MRIGGRVLWILMGVLLFTADVVHGADDDTVPDQTFANFSLSDSPAFLSEKPSESETPTIDKRRKADGIASSDDDDRGVIIQTAAMKKQELEQPDIAPTVEQDSPTTPTRLAATELSAVFSASQANIVSQLSAERRNMGAGTASDFVLGLESNILSASDVGDLLSKSNAVLGVVSEHRTPIVTYNVARGKHVGQQAGSGSYWFPARQDLDTLMSKIDSRIVDDVLVIKGPYAARFGPGFSFYDVQLKQAPRYANGYESHAVSVLDWNGNGDQWYGRETVMGGSNNWGFRVGYGDRSGSDYSTGLDTGPIEFSEMPSSYHSKDWDVALGWDPTPYQHIDFTYLRLDQSDVEFPGQIFDFDYLVTDAFELTYVNECTRFCDRLELEGWYNHTRFEGNAQGAGKRRQIPSLDDRFTLGIVLDLFTDVDASSAGYVFAATWGDDQSLQMTYGTDLRYLKQSLNELSFPSRIIPPNIKPENNPIPPAYSANPGMFVELNYPVSCRLALSGGGRVDWVFTNAFPFVDRNLDGNPNDLEQELGAPFDQSFDLRSGYVTADYELGCHWEMSTSVGYGMRPPTMTELYAVSPFVAVFPQLVLTTVRGNPNAESERMWQVDVGLDADYENFRGGMRGYYAWIDNYLTYAFDLSVSATRYTSVNESHATLKGYEAYAEVDWTDCVTGFVTVAYVEGKNHLRNEPLPSIPPLESRSGIRLHDPSHNPLWGVEFAARVVNDQDRTARSLLELQTAGFTTFDLRAYAQLSSNLLWTIGVENIFDRFYQEHLDPHAIPRTLNGVPVGVESFGVFQPGANFYTGMVWEY